MIPLLVAGTIAALCTAYAGAAHAQPAPVRQVTIGRNAEFRVNGKPFLPVMVWVPGEEHFAAIAEANVNTIGGYPGDDAAGMAAYAQTAWRHGFYFVAGCDAKLIAAPNLLGWFQGDEPDLARTDRAADGSVGRTYPRATTGEMLSAYRAIRAIDTTRPVFMTLTAAFMRDDSTWDQALKERMYPSLLQACDVVGFDTYPIFGTGTPGRLRDVANGTAELRALAGPHKPVYAWIETNRGSQWMTPSKQPDVKPEHTRAEVWMALIQGARAIGYFTHKWFDPDGTANYSSFAPTAEMRSELKRLNAQLTRLAPALLADPARADVKMRLSGDLPCHLKATRHDGSLYIFAQNTDLGEDAVKLRQFDPISPRSGRATFIVEGLRAGTRIEVVDEDRTLTTEAGGFSDGFGPLAEHVYRIRQ